ncbi:hypothetical protein SCALM49S_08242 [Streptomyces californicus]
MGTAGVLGVLHPALLPLLLLSVLPVGAAAVRSARARFHSFKRWNALQRRVRVFSWLLLERDAAAELRSDTAQGALLEEHHRLTTRIAEEDTRLGVSSAKLSLAGRAVGGIGTGTTYTALGAMLIAGWLPLAAGAGAVLAIQAAQTSLTRLVDVSHLVYEHAMWVDDLLAFQERCRALQPRRSGLPAPGTVRTITLDDVTFTYPGKDTPALNGISMTLHAGQTVAFVGVNGSVTCSATVLDHEGHVPHARHEAPLLDKVNCRLVSPDRGATWRSPAPLSLLWPMSWWRSGSDGGTDRRAGGVRLSGGTRRTRFSMGNDRPAGEAAAGAALRARSGVDVRVVAVGHRSRSRDGPGRCGHRVPPREHRRPRRAPPTRDGLCPPRPVSPA